MAIDRAQAERTLRALKNTKQREYDYWKTAKRKISPAERAMTLASLQEDIDALEFVLNKEAVG